MIDPFSPTTAMVVFLGITASILALTVMWAIANTRPARRHAHLTGRAAAPYSQGWYQPPEPADQADE